MLLLSVLIVVLAATSAMASNITLKWVGGTSTTTNYWGHTNNWQILSGDGSVVSYDRISSKINRLKDAIEFYPGGFTMKDSSDKVYVVISKDANITMTNVSNVAGGLRGITSMDISGKLSLDMGSASFFYDTPSISVSKDAGLKITGSHAQAFRIADNVTWVAHSADLTLGMPVTFVSSGALSIDVHNGNLTIRNEALLGKNVDTNTYYTSKKVKLTVHDDKSNPTAKLIFDVAAAPDARALDVVLSGKARQINTLQDVTLNVYSVDVKQAISTDTSTFIKDGAGTLTLNKSANTAGSKGIPVISADTFTVNAGTLKITGAGLAPLGRYASDKVIKFTVKNGATLDLGTRTISADNGASVDITVDAGGTVLFGDTAIDCGDNYDDGKLVLSADLLVTVNGTLTFAGSQAVKSVSGSGVIESTASGAMLLLNGTSDDIKDFTGTLNGLDVGIASSWDVIPFLTNDLKDGSTINNLYVFGPNGALTLDKSKMKGIEGLNETNIYLRSNMPGVLDYEKLFDLAIGKLLISGDISLNVVSVDGTRSADAVAQIEFLSRDARDARLTVNKLALHANADTDFEATAQQAKSNNVYTNAYAIEISGPGTFAPKLIVNGAEDNDVKVGQKDSITVDNGATLELRGGVQFPANNGLLLRTASIDVENNTRISGDFVIDGHSRIRVALTGANTREYAGEENIETAAIVVGETFRISGDSTISVDIADLVDAGKFLGKMYSLVGYNNFDIGTKTAVDLSKDVAVIGDYGLRSGDTKPAVNVGVSSKVIWAMLQKWMIKPVVYEWKVISGDENALGSGNSQFTAVLEYGVSDDITPKDDLLDCLNASITLRYDGSNANPSMLEEGAARQSVLTADGEPLGFFKFDNDRANHRLVLSGTSYVTQIETLVNLAWSMTNSAQNVYAKARVTTSTGGDLGEDFAHNGQITSEDLINLVGESRVLKNRSKVSDDTPAARSEDIYSDVTPTIVSPTTVFETNASANFEFSIPGLTATPVTAAPTLVGGVYVWNNGISSTDRYMFNGEEVTDIQVYVNDAPIPMADVTLTPDANGNMIVSIPVSLLGTSDGYLPSYKNIKITAKAVSDGATYNITGPTVTITPVYTEGTVEEGRKSVTVRTNQLPFNSGQIAEYSMTDPVSVDATVDGAEKPAWLTLNVSGGVVAYSLTANAPAGTHNVTIYVYNAQGAYKYEFTVTVEEGFAITGETVFDSAYAGLNYEAHFTTNAPAGTVVTWNMTDAPAWLKSAVDGEMFVVYGQLPPYVDDDEAETDPNEYTYTVTATAGDETAPSHTETINVEKDTDETVDHTGFTAGTITPNGDIISADSNYSVEIDFNADYQDTEIDFLSLPYWLAATPKTAVVDDAEVITGYTIAYKTGSAVTAGEAGVVRFEDPDSGNIISWPVTFNETVQPTPPTPDEFTYNVSAAAASVALNATDTSITITPVNNLGTVSYASDASWVTVDANGAVTIAPTDPALVSDTAHTVTITLTDGGRTENNTQTVTLAITVTGGGQPGPELTVTASQTALTLTAGTTATVTMTANVPGVTYTSDKTWAVVSGDTVTITAPSATDTVTITGTAPDRRTATATITVTVSDGGTTTTFSLERMFTSRSFDISRSPVTLNVDDIVRPVNNQGTVTYTWTVSPATGLAISVSNGVVTLTATRAGTYTVAITGTDAAGQKADTSITVVVTSGSSGGGDIVSSLGSSGGGCDAGFGALALALAAPLFLRRRRS